MNTPPEQSEIETFHALLAESDAAVIYTRFYVIGFLSTLSLRRATYLRNNY